MDQGIRALALAIEDAMARHGRRGCVNGRAAAGDVAVSLTRTKDGRVAMIRQPLPGEGGRVTLNYPNAALVDGRLGAKTLAWIETWALLDLGAPVAHAARMAALGLAPDAFHPGVARTTRLLARTVGAAGLRLGEVLSAGSWARSAEGHVMTVAHPALEEEAVFTRCLGEVEVRGAMIRLGGATLLINDDGPVTSIGIHGGRPPPDTVMAAAVGSELSRLVALPDDAGRGSRIESAGCAPDGSVIITARCPREPLSRGERP